MGALPLRPQMAKEQKAGFCSHWKAEGNCPNRLLAAASAKIHIPNRCFTPASPSTSLSFQFKSGLSASDWQMLVAIQLGGNATFASLMLAG